MAQTVNQAKLNKTIFAIQTAKGTAEPATTPAVYDVLPVIDDTDMPLDRGTLLISRANTIDGFAGEMCGVPGSWGYSPSFTVEIHEQLDGLNIASWPYWMRLLLCSGHEAEYNNDTVFVEYEITPSTRNIRDLTAQALGTVDGTTYGPYLGTLQRIRYSSTESNTNNTREESYDTVFGATFNLESGERATITFDGKGSLAGDPQKANLSQWFPLGATGTNLKSGVGCSPFVVKNIKIEIDEEEPVSLASLEFNTNAQLDDVVDPREENGFGASNVIWEEAPTVSFNIAEEIWNTSNASLKNILLKMKTGASVAIKVELTSPSGDSFLEFSFPRCQYSEVTRSPREGFAAYDVTTKVVRSPGQENQYTIKYYYPL